MKNIQKLILPVLFGFLLVQCQSPTDSAKKESGKPNTEINKRQSSGSNLVKNPGFEKLDLSTGLPETWSIITPRQEVSPAFELDSSVSRSGKYSIKSTAKGSPGTIGYWVTTVNGVQSEEEAKNINMSEKTLRDTGFLSNRSYRIGGFFRTEGVESPFKSIWIRINWLDKKGGKVFSELISGFENKGLWNRFEQVVTAPKPAINLSIELSLQWTSTGTVWWDDISLEEAPAPVPRKIKLATVCAQPPAPSTPEKNIKYFADQIGQAGKQGADILCLGEAITIVSTRKTVMEVAEPVPGPTSRTLGKAAKKYGLYVVVGIYEREGALIYNTALLIDREGNVAGKYRKTHLPETEVLDGMTPGNTYPVFKTDFGTIGIEICYDNFFPEVCRSLALNGAEIILLPIWGDGREKGYVWDIVARARAIDNSVFLVASIYSNNRSLIIDRSGQILADTKGEQKLITAEINLDERIFERWLSVGSYGEWKNLYPKERRSLTYKNLVMDDHE